MRKQICVGMGIALTAGGAAAAGQPDGAVARITVTWTEASTSVTPMSATLPPGTAITEHAELVPDGHAGEPLPAQISGTDPGVVRWLAPPAAAPGPRAYWLRPVEVAPPARVVCEKTDTTLRIALGDQPVLAYRSAPMPPPEGAGKRYTRSAFIHPLWSPAGDVLTRIHPRDHIHHMGIWNPWTRTEFEGKKVDFWNLKAGQGTVRFGTFESVSQGPVCGTFRSLHDHVVWPGTEAEKVALKESWDVVVWNTAGTGDPFFIVDVTIRQRCASESPLHLKAYRYGGFGFRARDDWDKGNYLTSEGKNRADGHASRARWCHAYGPTPNGTTGVLFLSHPDNRDHPEPMRLWPKGHIFFNFCPVQKRPWELTPGNTYVLRYRMCVYNGEATADMGDTQWARFAHAPKTTILSID